MRRGGARFAGDELEEEDDDDESGEFDSNISDSCDGEDEGGRVRGGKGRRDIDDEMFDKVMEEYGSDDLGDLEDEVPSNTTVNDDYFYKFL
jgi:hypothetical protein